MKTRKTKRTNILISILLILSFCVTFLSLSCAKQDESTTDSNTTTDNNEVTEPEAEGTTEKAYQFPEVDYEGYEMKILNLSPDAANWAITNLDVEEETGDVILDSIYRRNRTVEDKLNVVITEIAVTDSPARIKKSVNAGTDEYDVTFGFSKDIGPIASAGMFLDLLEIDSLKLDEPWWDQGALKSFELMERLYFTTTDAHVMTNDSIWVAYFNKQMVQDLQLEDPYQLVRDNKWTMDAMLSMARQAATDIDGDGEFTVNDRWGISTHDLAMTAFLICTDSPLVTKDKDGYPQLLEPTERFISAFLKCRELLDATAGVYLHSQGTYKGRTADLDHAKKTFVNNMSLFCTECLSHARYFREMENDFGLLPHPKYDENQAEYLSFMVDTTPTFGIPIPSADPERTGVFMEALTGLSATTLIPAYYEISLENKFMRDEDSIEMLDIIRAGRVYELAVVYNWSGFYGTLQTYGVSASGTNPMTIYEKNGERTRATIQKTVESFEAVE